MVFIILDDYAFKNPWEIPRAWLKRISPFKIFRIILSLFCYHQAMIAKVLSGAVVGLDAAIIEVEATVSNGLPATIIVGLPDTAVQESRERVKAAMKNSECEYPPTRVSVNLAPADVPKVGTHFDLPIALSIVLASEKINFSLEGKIFVGELSLDGSVRSVPGVLAIALAANSFGAKEIYVPAENAVEASLVEGLTVFAVSSLSILLRHLLGVVSLVPVLPLVAKDLLQKPQVLIDMKDIAGQELAKRALEIASSGGHNVLLYGPPGSGKTLLARAMSGILPLLSSSEALELTKIYSIAGKLHGRLVTTRPVRSPHHTTSHTALVGGGSDPRPGEITLAHRGILFLDEFPEFPRHVLEALRQPLEDGHVTVARAKNTVDFPAQFMLVAALNPCPCGYYGDGGKRCLCTPGQIYKYQKKISGPLIDRIDLHIEVPRLPYEKMMKDEEAESSEKIVARVELARELQFKRFGQSKTNSEMNVVELKKYCKLGQEQQELLRNAMKQYALSGRGAHRLLKIARTIADLAGSELLATNHLAEALQYRPKLND